jgi:uncharacterized protein YjiS (DUF1127 family)
MEDAMAFYSDAQTPSHVARAVDTITGIVVERVRSAIRILKNRRNTTALAAVGDHILADIGLTRGEVRVVFSEAWPSFGSGFVA